jgi:transcriptional regulator with XRE-family HTH domain
VVAQRSGIVQSSIARLESGRRMPTIDVLMRVASACDAELVIEFKPLVPPRKKRARG